MNVNSKSSIVINNSEDNAKTLNSISTFWDFVIAFFLFLFCMYTFNKMYSLQEDQALHLSFIFRKIELHCLFTQIVHNSIMQWLVYFLGLGNKTIMYQALPFILSLAFVSKYFVVRWINIDFIGMHDLRECNQWLLRLMAILISFSYPIYTYLQIIFQNWYRGLTPQCVWHNPTIIVAMPFAILFFWESYKLLISFSRKLTAILLFLLFVNLLTKPVFLMPCLPIFFLYFLFGEYKNGKWGLRSISKRNFLLTMLFLLPFTLISILLYNRLFSDFGISFSFVDTLKNHDMNYHFVSNVSFVMRRMFDISSTNPFLLFCFIFSALLLRIFLLNNFYIFTLFFVCKKVLFQNLYAISIWTVGLIISLFATEIKNPSSENFLWHMITCNMILLVVGSNNFIYHVFSRETQKNYVFTYLAFGGLCLQAYCGILYLLNLMFKGVWY